MGDLRVHFLFLNTDGEQNIFLSVVFSCLDNREEEIVTYRFPI